MEIPISLKLKLARVAPCVFVVALGGCTQAPRIGPNKKPNAEDCDTNSQARQRAIELSGQWAQGRNPVRPESC